MDNKNITTIKDIIEDTISKFYNAKENQADKDLFEKCAESNKYFTFSEYLMNEEITFYEIWTLSDEKKALDFYLNSEFVDEVSKAYFEYLYELAM